MFIFDKTNTAELKEFLYNNYYIHDAKLQSIEYKYIEDYIKVKLFNQIFNIEIIITFSNIQTAIAIKGCHWGERETVISLTVEDILYSNARIPKHIQNIDNSLYLLFQTFSGDELHIVSKKVMVE